MKEKTKKKILLAFICIITVVVLIVTIKIHENMENNLLSISKIDKYLTEIKYKEISTHVIEQPNTIIYVSNSSDENSINFENHFKDVVKKYNLENEIIYININNTNIIDPFYQYAPELIFYKDGEVSDMIDCSTLKSKKDIIKELKERSVISD